MCRKRGDHIRTDIDPKKCNKANKGERRLKRYADGCEQRESELGCKACRAAKQMERWLGLDWAIANSLSAFVCCFSHRPELVGSFDSLWPV